jgi:hypothetical protein
MTVPLKSTMRPALRVSYKFNLIMFSCPNCGAKLISIDLLHIKHLHCLHCDQHDCHNGAKAETFQKAYEVIKQNYERTINKTVGLE